MMLSQQIFAWREQTLSASGFPHLPFSMEKTNLLHRASHMEDIYPICLAQQDSQHAAPKFTSIYWIKALQRKAMAYRLNHHSLTKNIKNAI